MSSSSDNPQAMGGKVLVVIDDGEVRIHHTPGTDVICIVDGENMQLPIDWTGKLTHEIKHTMPIEVRFSEMFREEGDDSDVILEDGIYVAHESTSVTLHDLRYPLKQGEFIGPSINDLLDGTRENDVNKPILASESSSQCPETPLAGTKGPEQPRRSLMKQPYCEYCDENHPPGKHSGAL